MAIDNPLHLTAPAVAVIDQNFNMTLSFTPSARYGGATGLPPADSTPATFADYDHWLIRTTINAGPNHDVTFPAPIGYAGGSLTFSEILSAGTITLTMAAFDSSSNNLTQFWTTNGANLLPGAGTPRTFPTLLTASNIIFSSTSVLLSESLTVTLSNTYAGADQWQVNWPDGTSTGWLPLASNVVTKSFSTPGTFNVTIQTRRNYSGAQFDPAVTLISQIVQQIFVVNQQATGTTSSQSGLQGNLGIGGQAGFEIVNANSGTATPEPWEVIARALVRDTLTSELKLLIATSRFSNASSLFGTMALDVFPIEGRPRSKELVVPPYELTATSQTETVPVKITTTALPTLFVGKSVTQATGGTFALQAANGIQPYIWSSVGLPEGLTINASGFLLGTPLELGIFNVTIAVQDSSIPFSIDEVTLQLTVETDLKVQIAPGQTDANNTPLAQQGTTLGVAQVGKPYQVQMQVGNINPNSSQPGGLAPYTWSAPAGAFPVGLSIDPNLGLISGTPATYNSTTDFSTTFSVTVQVTDAIGAKATQVYTMTLKPQALSFGHINQPTIYTFEQFKMVVPVFGGQSPYSSLNFFPGTGDANFYGTPQLVDGQVEIPVGYTAINSGGFSNTGVHTFALEITDATATVLGPVSVSFKVEKEISDINLARVPLVNWTHPSDGSWALNDPSEAGQAVNHPIQINGNFNTIFSGGLPAAQVVGQRLNLTHAANTVGGKTAYTMINFPGFAALVGQNVVISGFGNALNNGTFQVQAGTTGTSLLVNNSAGVAQNAPNYVLTLTNATAQTTVGGLTVAVFTYTPPATYGNGALNAYAGMSFTTAGFLNVSNNQTFTCISSTATTITVLNPGTPVVTEAHAATATTTLAKALVLGVVGNTDNGTVLVGVPNPATMSAFNGVTIAIDPTNVTVDGTPDAEFYGPAGPNANVSGGSSYIFSNTETKIPLVVNLVFPLTSVALGTGVYAGTITGGGANAFAGQNFTVSGFANAANNGTFPCTASTTTSITLTNPSSVAETTTVGQQAIALKLTSSVTNPTDDDIIIAGFGGQVSRTYSTLSHNATFVSGDIGTITTYARPMIVGDVVGINPRKPYFDSADIPPFNTAWKAVVQAGSQLPPGLSLDANTGLIYGTLTGITSLPSVIQYVDGSGGVHGTITITWITLLNQFQMVDNIVDSQLVGAVYNGAGALTPPGGIVLQSVSTFGSSLPSGLSASVNNGTNAIDITGTPTEAGYFDVWFTVISTNGKTASIYHRISTVIPAPILSILGWADVIAGPALGPTQGFPLPNGIIGGSYVNPVTGNPIALVLGNAVAPVTYTTGGAWVSNPFHGINLALGPGTPEPAGGIGLFTGTVAGPAGTFNVSFTVSDSDIAHVPFTVNTQLSIQATALTLSPATFPSVTAGHTYTAGAPLITFQGGGSVLTPFTFSVSPVSPNQLPVGLTLTSDSPDATHAIITGTTTQTGYGTKTVIIRVSDTSGAYLDKSYTVTVAASLSVTSGLHASDPSNPANFLGLVDAGSVLSINVRPNLSFFLVATQVVSQSTAGITVQTNNGSITGSVFSLNTGTQTAQIELSGSGFNQAVSGTPYSVTVTINDSGVINTQTFMWTVYDDGTMALKASNATPTRLTTPT